MIYAYENKHLKSMDGEIWLPLVGYETLYEVSNLGRVKRLGRWWTNTKRHPFYKKESIVAQVPNGQGYLTVKLMLESYKTINWLVNIAVAKCFIENPNNKPEVNHKSGIILDNTVGNLEWATHQENMDHAKISGLLIRDRIKIRANRRGVPATKPVLQLTKELVLVKKWDSQFEAAKSLGINQPTLSKAVTGTYKTAGGFIWEQCN